MDNVRSRGNDRVALSLLSLLTKGLTLNRAFEGRVSGGRAVLEGKKGSEMIDILPSTPTKDVENQQESS